MQFLWPTGDEEKVSLPCPACGADGPHGLALLLPGMGFEGADWVILDCASCASRFSTDRTGADYHPDSLPAVIDFYLEQSAGILAMLHPLGWAEPGGGKRLLEIGGGVGFTSDFAQLVLGWTATGYDPAELADIGRQHLGLDITRSYWTDQSPLDATYDVAFASEVVEHVPDPQGFLAGIRHAVGDTGIAILTTPDGAALNPGTAPAILGAIAAPCIHLTLFSADGLERALRTAGFQQVRVDRMGTGLTAFAANVPLPAPAPLPRGRYCDYLRQRIARPTGLHSLDTGMRIRLFKELVSSGITDEALALYDAIRDTLTERFGRDITSVDAIPSQIDRHFTEWLAELPGCLPALLHYRAILANNGQGDAATALRYAAAAALAGASLRRTLRPALIDDGETEMVVTESIGLALLAMVGVGADPRSLLAAMESGSPDQGVLLSGPVRRGLRERLARDLAATHHPAALWRVHGQLSVEQGEIALLQSLASVGATEVPIAAFDAISAAVDANEVERNLDTIWQTPGAAHCPASIRHARKLALIRLAQLGAFDRIRALFLFWDSPTLAHDAPVRFALHLANVPGMSEPNG